MKKYKIVDKNGKVIKYFNAKNTAINWLSKLERIHLTKLKIEKNDK